MTAHYCGCYKRAVMQELHDFFNKKLSSRPSTKSFLILGNILVLEVS